MKRRLFIESDVFPSETILRKQSISAMTYYHDIMSTSIKYLKRWQFNHGNGWILRVDDNRDAIYYLAAFEDGIEISLTVRDQEKADFLENNEIQDIHNQIKLGTKYAGGYALRFPIESVKECSSIQRFLRALFEIRSRVMKIDKKETLRINKKLGRAALVS
ncbi:MAG: hypothetical protein E4G91_09145 [Candidatus Zixiibacteriota bacterium]|nr:MAG: hypothetical protein E4G91_09145 [candidate division Zixibacteria bacterium]